MRSYISGNKREGYWGKRWEGELAGVLGKLLYLKIFQLLTVTKMERDTPAAS